MVQATTFGATAPQPQPANQPAPVAPQPVEEKEGEKPPDQAPISHLLRYWAWKYVGTLVMEQNSQGVYVMSLGRVCTAVLLAQAMWRWGEQGGDIPQSMLQTLWILLGYNLGTKGITIAHQWIDDYQGRGKFTAPGGSPP
jgi:hypothetical protein